MTEHRVWVYGDNVNTDVIFPGKYTYTLKSREDIASKALEDLDPTFIGNVVQGDVIVAGANWGCGSSREQAVTALKYAGVSMIFAASFGGLYFRNCINQGVRPVVAPELHLHIQAGDSLQIDLSTGTVTVPDGYSFVMPEFSPSVQAILDAGGLVPMLQSRFQGETA